MTLTQEQQKKVFGVLAAVLVFLVFYRLIDVRDKKGWSVDAIVRDLLGRPSLVEAVTLGNFSRRHLVLSYLRNYGGSAP